MDSWETLTSQKLLEAEPWLSVYRDTVRLPNDRIIDDFYRVGLPDFAIVVPVTKEGKLVTVRSYKHGLGKVTLSLPAGHIEPGELPLEAAKRELFEETGYQSETWENLGNFLVNGNRQCGRGHFFLARDAVCIAPENCGDATENLQVELRSIEDCWQRIRSGEIELLATVNAIALAMVSSGRL